MSDAVLSHGAGGDEFTARLSVNEVRSVGGRETMKLQHEARARRHHGPSARRSIPLPAALRLAHLSLLLALWACGGEDGPKTPSNEDVAAEVGGDAIASDAATSDAAISDTTASDTTAGDVATSDTTTSDAAAGDTATSDAAASDTATTSGPKITPWGEVTGACGDLAPSLKDSGPSFRVTTYTFGKAAAFDASQLSTGPKKRYQGENAGGSSVCSEVMSMQLMEDCEGAPLHKTEKEITYTSDQGAITDYIAKLGPSLVGVSVTRAYKGPVVQTYTDADAKKLLEKKLAGVNVSSAKVSAGDKWVKQVLHIWTLRADWVPQLKAAWESLDATLKADTVVWVTVEQHPDEQEPWIVPDQCGLK